MDRVVGVNVGFEIFNSKRFVVPLCILNEHFSAKSVNIEAWKVFNMSWKTYIETIVQPCCSKKDKERFDVIKDWDPPATTTKLTRVVKKYNPKLRIWYLMYNVVDNCIALNISLPDCFYITVEENKKIKLVTAKSSAIATARGKAKKEEDISTNKRKKKRQELTAREQERAKNRREERDVIFSFNRLEKQQYEAFQKKKRYFAQHSILFMRIIIFIFFLL